LGHPWGTHRQRIRVSLIKDHCPHSIYIMRVLIGFYRIK
jgi:hypothetical protein